MCRRSPQRSRGCKAAHRRSSGCANWALGPGRVLVLAKCLEVRVTLRWRKPDLNLRSRITRPSLKPRIHLISHRRKSQPVLVRRREPHGFPVILDSAIGTTPRGVPPISIFDPNRSLTAPENYNRLTNPRRAASRAQSPYNTVSKIISGLISSRTDRPSDSLSAPRRDPRCRWGGLSVSDGRGRGTYA